MSRHVHTLRYNAYFTLFFSKEKRIYLEHKIYHTQIQALIAAAAAAAYFSGEVGGRRGCNLWLRFL